MPYAVAAKNLMLERLRQAITHLSLHSGPPTAANELRGTEYARIPVAFAGAAGGAITLKDKPMFAVQAGSKVTHVGFWNAINGGVLLASGSTKEASFEKRGVYVIDAAKLDLNLDAPAAVKASFH